MGTPLFGIDAFCTFYQAGQGTFDLRTNKDLQIEFHAKNPPFGHELAVESLRRLIYSCKPGGTLVGWNW